MTQTTDLQLMNAIAYIIPGTPANTRIGTLGNPIVVEDEYTLSRGRFPAVHIEIGKQRHQIVGTNVFDGYMQFIISYYDRWDRSTQLIDTIRKQIKSDLQQIMVNLQKNSSLSVGGTSYATSIYRYELSPYKGELDDKTIPGYTLVKRSLTIRVNILPYDI